MHVLLMAVRKVVFQNVLGEVDVATARVEVPEYLAAQDRTQELKRVLSLLVPLVHRLLLSCNPVQVEVKHSQQFVALSLVLLLGLDPGKMVGLALAFALHLLLLFFEIFLCLLLGSFNVHLLLLDPFLHLVFRILLLLLSFLKHLSGFLEFFGGGIQVRIFSHFAFFIAVFFAIGVVVLLLLWRNLFLCKGRLFGRFFSRRLRA